MALVPSVSRVGTGNYEARLLEATRGLSTRTAPIPVGPPPRPGPLQGDSARTTSMSVKRRGARSCRIRLAYFWEYRIPFANWIISRVWLSSQTGRGLGHRGGSHHARASHRGGGCGAAESLIGRGHRAARPSGRTTSPVPLVSTWTMRMMSDPCPMGASCGALPMSAERTARARRRAARGQALILTVLLMLFVTVAVFLTFTIGTRTRRKIQLQAVADSTAYSLAVAEARAFNFYAFSNRAIVAHERQHPLGARPHQLSLLLRGSARRHREQLRGIMARGATGRSKLALLRIADLYLNSDFDPGRRALHLDRTTGASCDALCDGAESCTVDDNRIRGAQWFARQWARQGQQQLLLHAAGGSRDHFHKVEFLHAHQLGVESQLRLMMTGEEGDMMPVEDRARLDASTTPGAVRRPRGKIVALPQRVAGPAPGVLADPNPPLSRAPGERSLRYYDQAVR